MVGILCYSHFAARVLDVVVEESGSRGRADPVVRFERQVFLFEIKVVERGAAGSALAQRHERGCVAKYRAAGRPVHLIGIEFSRETRDISHFETAAA